MLSKGKVKRLSELRFSVLKANSNKQLQHVSMGTGYFSFEESVVGSSGVDHDFNDLQFLISPIDNDGLLV